MAATPPLLFQAARSHAQGQLLHAAEFYRQALIPIPGHTPHPEQTSAALLGLALLARQSHQLPAALTLARAAVATLPTSALAFIHLGHACLVLHQFPQAEAAYHHALTLEPQNPLAILAWAEMLALTQRPEQAATLFENLLTTRPNLAAAHYGLANTHALREEFPTALISFERALAIHPAHPESHFAIGFCLTRLGRHPEAIAAFRHAVTLRPAFASAWLNLAVALIADGRDQLAELCYHQALAANPELLSAHLNLGNLERSRRRFPQALTHYQRALACPSACPPANDPRHSDVHVALAYLHLEQHDFPPALAHLEQAQSLRPHNAEIPNALGILLLTEAATQPSWEFQRARIQAAIPAFAQAESLGHKTAASNRGNALLRLGHTTQALAAHQQAVANDPHHPGARYNLALTQLRLGDFAHGWPNYEIRWAFREIHPHPRRFPHPRWQGEPAPPGPPPRLFLYAEQGLGDTLQFIRYLPLAAARGFCLILEVQPPLLRLLQPLADALNCHIISADLTTSPTPLPEFDLHAPLLSLPAIFQTTVESVPNQTPYLQLNPNLTRNLHPTPPDIPRIGLAWAGNPNYRADHERSTHLKTFLPLLGLPNLHWLSLQKGPAAHQILSLPTESAPTDASSNDRDLADTAALIATVDLVLTTDTAIAHLAGALNKPTWLLLPWQSDWRWMQDSTTTPWYPNTRLFRQTSPNNWPALIQTIAKELTTTFPQTPPNPTPPKS